MLRLVLVRWLLPWYVVSNSPSRAMELIYSLNDVTTPRVTASKEDTNDGMYEKSVILYYSDCLRS